MINLEMIGYYSDALGSQRYPPLYGLRRVLPEREFCRDREQCGLGGVAVAGVLGVPAERAVSDAALRDAARHRRRGYVGQLVVLAVRLPRGDGHRHLVPTATGTTISPPITETLHLPALTRVVEGVAGAVVAVGGGGVVGWRRGETVKALRRREESGGSSGRVASS